LTRYLICQKSNLKNHQLQFNQTEYGKPFLQNNRNFFYNISHSGEWVVCAFANSAVGIDVEKMASVDLHLAQRILTPAEYEAFLTKSSSEQQLYFYSLWTLKESFIKAVGKGLSIPLDSFAIRGDPGAYFTIYPEPGGDRYFFKQYDWGEAYRLSLCATTNIFSAKVKLVTVAECQKKFAAAGN
jgi:4'-phosphopantetheinyl transferase